MGARDVHKLLQHYRTPESFQQLTRSNEINRITRYACIVLIVFGLYRTRRSFLTGNRIIFGQSLKLRSSPMRTICYTLVTAHEGTHFYELREELFRRAKKTRTKITCAVLVHEPRLYVKMSGDPIHIHIYTDGKNPTGVRFSVKRPVTDVKSASPLSRARRVRVYLHNVTDDGPATAQNIIRVRRTATSLELLVRRDVPVVRLGYTVRRS